MKQKNQEQIEMAAKFAVGLGVVCLILVIFVRADFGSKCRGAVAGLALLGWGSSQLALARKRGKNSESRQEQIQDERLEKQLEKLDKSGSMQNVVVLLLWILLIALAVCVICVGYLVFSHRRH